MVVAAAIPRARLYLGEEATSVVLAQGCGGVDIIHVAGHGTFRQGKDIILGLGKHPSSDGNNISISARLDQLIARERIMTRPTGTPVEWAMESLALSNDALLPQQEMKKSLPL